jgi:hypothetical protein
VTPGAGTVAWVLGAALLTAVGGAPVGAAARPVGAGSPAVWVVPSTVRVPVAAAPGSRTAASIEAARGETESFQVVVHARGGPLRSVRVHVSALRRVGGGGTISGGSLALFREQYVRVPTHSPAWSGPRVRWRWFPDALVPFVDPVTGRPPRAGRRYPASPFDVRRGHNQPVWVDVTVPRDAAAGVYTGTWSVRAAGQRRTVTGTVRVRVLDFALPTEPSSGSRFSIRRAANRRAAVEDLLLRYRVQPSPATPGREGVMRRRGLDAADLDFWSGADVDHCTMRPAPSVEAVRAAAAGHLPGLRLYDYSADEVSRCDGLTGLLAAWGRALHEAGVDHLVTVVPRQDLMDDGTGRPVVDIWVLLPRQLRRLDPALREGVAAAGGEIWTYQALVQGRRTPSWQLDFPVTHYRVLGGFLNASQGVTGLLYWAVDRWQRDPWVDPTYAYPDSCCYPGDGTLVYPGRPAGVVGVVPSIRLAMVRDGMDDFDYVSLLRARGQGAQAAAVIAPAASSWWRWTSDGRVLAEVRHRLAELLEAGAAT